jgi:hypothetical protein
VEYGQGRIETRENGKSVYGGRKYQPAKEHDADGAENDSKNDHGRDLYHAKSTVHPSRCRASREALGGVIVGVTATTRVS